jgi:hypothetical protein
VFLSFHNGLRSEHRGRWTTVDLIGHWTSTLLGPAGRSL